MTEEVTGSSLIIPTQLQNLVNGNTNGKASF